MQTTVIAATVARAETLTKAALLLGPEHGGELLEREPGVEGLLVLADGSLRASRGLAALRAACHAA